MVISINEANDSPGFQNSNYIYKCKIPLLFGVNGPVGLGGDMLSLYYFLKRRYFPIYVSNNSVDLNIRSIFKLELPVVSLQFYKNNFTVKLS